LQINWYFFPDVMVSQNLSGDISDLKKQNSSCIFFKKVLKITPSKKDDFPRTPKRCGFLNDNR